MQAADPAMSLPAPHLRSEVTWLQIWGNGLGVDIWPEQKFPTPGVWSTDVDCTGELWGNWEQASQHQAPKPQSNRIIKQLVSLNSFLFKKIDLEFVVLMSPHAVTEKSQCLVSILGETPFQAASTKTYSFYLKNY